MKDLIMLIAIVSFWFLLAVSITAISRDTSMYSVADNSNISFGINQNASDIQINFTSTTDTDITPSKTKRFLDTVSLLFGNRVPEYSEVPLLIVTFIAVLNYLLFVITGLLVWRLIRSGAG